MDLQIMLECWVANFTDQFAKHFDHTDTRWCAKSSRTNIYLFFAQIETEKLTRNRSGKAFIQTRWKQGVSFTKDALIDLWIFNGLNSNWTQFLIPDQVSKRQRNEFWGHPFHSVCPLSIFLSCLIEPAGANTDTAILSSAYFQIFLHSHNSQWQPGGGGREHIRFCLPLFPRHWHLSQGSNFHFCLMFDSPRYLQYKLLVSVLIVYSGRARRGIGWEFAWLKAKYWDCGKKQDPRSQCLGSAGEKDDSEWGAGNWESFTSDHSPASRIIAGSSLSGLRRHKKPSLERREVWWDGEGEDLGPCVNISWQCLVLKIKISIRQAPLLSAMRIKFVGSVNNKKQACSLLQILNIKKSVPADWQMRKG